MVINFYKFLSFSSAMVKLILVRHGESLWNLENKFTGWIDIELSKKGIDEAKKAGKKLANFEFQKGFTSLLVRAEDTLRYILEENNFIENFRFKPSEGENLNWYDNINNDGDDEKLFEVIKSEKLNERYYGDLQGLNKGKTVERFGEEQVHLWRRSFDISPPNGESLKMTSERTIPFFREVIGKDLLNGKNVLVVAHGNSLRSIIMYLEKLSSEEILDVEIPTGIPIIYELDNNLNVVSKNYLN